MTRPDELLLHYFELAGVDTSGDRGVEIQEIVSGIVEEAVELAQRDIPHDLFCFSCGTPRSYIPIEERLQDNCECHAMEPPETIR